MTDPGAKPPKDGPTAGRKEPQSHDALDMFDEPEDGFDARAEPRDWRALPAEADLDVDLDDLETGSLADVEPAHTRPAGPASLPPPAPPGGPLPVGDAQRDSQAPNRPLRIIAMGGARGGVGKTVLAANLGLYLATIGRRVVLVDADPGGANLHSCLGSHAPVPLSRVKRSGNHKPESTAAAIPAEALGATPIPNLRLLHAGLDESGSGDSRGERLTRLMARLRSLDAEYVVVDLGVGTSRALLDAYLGADLALFVTVPEPTAMENTYRFFRAAFARYVLDVVRDPELQAELERKLKALGGAPPPLDLLGALRDEGSPLLEVVRQAMERFHPNVVVNQTRLRTDLHLGFAMQSAARRRLGIQIDYVGHVDHDDSVWTCVRARRPLLLEVPGAKSSKKIEKIARRLLLLEAGKFELAYRSSVPLNSHHDLLEVERGATDEEVRRAYKRSREVYAHDSACCYGLLEPHEIEAIRTRIDEAFDVLLDPARRRPYELSVFPDGPEPGPAERPAVDDFPDRPAPDIQPDTQFTGALIKQARESQRVSLAEISQRTKIGMTYLRAIEQDDFAALPAVVYTSGFVVEVARFLKLDTQQVSRTYVRRYKQYLDEKQSRFQRRQ
jgi:flagellar biosynthesis protein FlhG